jgi:phage replication-related protein YjqB (UPF0714/DUF867 family)
MVQLCRYSAASALILLSIATEAQAASLYSTKCGSLSGSTVSDPAVEVTEVEIVARVGPPPTNQVHRREHVLISAGLADALGIDAEDLALNAESPQIQVSLGSGDPVPSAVFTVTAIDENDTSLTLAVWLPSSSTDTHNGFFKLFGSADPTTVFASPQEGTVHSMAPGTTVVVEDGVATRYVHFTEPNNASSKHFRECVEIRGDDRLAVLVPHGGAIETSISDQLGALLTELEDYGYEPSVWESAGQWGGGSTFQRWHVTSTQFSTASFPGLGDLVASGTYQYAVGLHGFSETEMGVVLGGRSSRQVKCFLVSAIEDWLDNHGGLDGKITYKIFAPDNTSGPIDILRASTGSGDNPQPLDDVDDLDADSTHNIVNRLSPNASGTRGHGGIQIEMSKALRDDTSLFPEFILALAYALDQQIENDPTGDYCAQYE